MPAALARQEMHWPAANARLPTRLLDGQPEHKEAPIFRYGVEELWRIPALESSINERRNETSKTLTLSVLVDYGRMIMKPKTAASNGLAWGVLARRTYELRNDLRTTARYIRYAKTKEFFGTKMADGSSLQSHRVKMVSLVEKFENLKVGLDNDTKGFNLQSERQEARCWKRKKGKGKVTTATASAEGAPAATCGKCKGKAKVGGSQWLKANNVCILCQGKRHWKRECPKLLSNQSMFVIEVNMITNAASWVLDTGCGAQICNNLQGHISKDRIRKLVDSKSVEIDDLDNLPTSKSYLKGKMTKKAFVGQSVLANGLLDLIHTDVCRPLNTLERGGFAYFITFTDEQSWYGYVYLIRYKFEAFGRIKEYRLEVENQTGHKIKALRSDRGGEYLSGGFIDYLKENGMLSQWTPPETPQLNGVAKRRN
ncbi:UNVERIFIED_CONTAM: hypothetical protein Scaly_2718300 [Sesamum calycinum]|uniref:Integrase catalytic domain-containing protein n=1 Tax=Sesamum calycinum TaxID=2727403 RepID=A0AAW2J316_9LAMI